MIGTKFFLANCFKYAKSYVSDGAAGEFVIEVNKKSMFKFLFFLKNFDMLNYNRLIDIIIYDKMSIKNRFNVVYLLDSSISNGRCAVSVQTSEGVFLYSVINLFESAS